MPEAVTAIQNYQDLRATVLGLGTFGGGVAAARFLAEQGAEVSITDLRPAEDLKDSMAALQDVRIRGFYPGGHSEAALQNCDLLVVNPAVRPGSAEVARCRQAGVMVTSEIELFLRHCQAPVIGVTGSNGKSTTSALIHHLLQQHHLTTDTNVLLGGNIGHSLLPTVSEITADDIVVLELSSFQLHQLRQSNFAPAIAVITSFSANHLDWHGTVADYQVAKQVILNRQQATDVAIVPDDWVVNQPQHGSDPEFVWRVRGTCLRFGTRDTGEDGSFLEDGALVLRRGHLEEAIRLSSLSRLPGHHNVQNVAAACCAAWVAGAEPAKFADSLQHFEPLPHRLQLVAQGRGLRFYNDSVATTPESAIAALRTFDHPVVIIAGGSDKGADLRPLAEAIQERATAAVLIGQTAAVLADHLRQITDGETGPPVVTVDDFQNAFCQAVALAPQGGIVLLSPGCASYGWFRDYRERGDRFAQLACDWIRN